MDWQRADNIITNHLGSFLVFVLVAVTAFTLGSQYRTNTPVEQIADSTATETQPSSTIRELQNIIAKPPGSITKTASNQTGTIKTGLISINSASQAELETLPGIGPSKASAIISYRLANGPFARVDDLINVKGIGPKTLESLRPLVSL